MASIRALFWDVGGVLLTNAWDHDERNLAIELSTAGWRKPVNELYPSDEIITLAVDKKIPFTIASDAHSWAQLGENYERLAQKMSAFGIREVCVYEKHRRIAQQL